MQVSLFKKFVFNFSGTHIFTITWMLYWFIQDTFRRYVSLIHNILCLYIIFIYLFTIPFFNMIDWTWTFGFKKILGIFIKKKEMYIIASEFRVNPFKKIISWLFFLKNVRSKFKIHVYNLPRYFEIREKAL